MRLTEIGRELGLVDDARWRAFSEKREAIERETQRLKATVLHPHMLSTDETQRVFGDSLARDFKLYDLLRRPNVTYTSLTSLAAVGSEISDVAVTEQVEIQCKYAGYIDRQAEEIERQRRNEETYIPAWLDYAQVRGLSNEVRQKLQNQQPATIGQASRIPGVTPAAISLLLVHLKKGNPNHAA